MQDMDCDVCGAAIAEGNRYTLTITHGNMTEEFDFCSFSCLRRWTKQYSEEQQRARTTHLEMALAADRADTMAEDPDSDPLQDLEDEVQEHEQDAPPQTPYGVPVESEDESPPVYGGKPYAAEEEDDQYAEAMQELKQRTSPDDAEQSDTPIADFIEEADPVEKTKRDKEDREEQEQDLLQEEFDKAVEDSQK